jgi:hypothetical protein
MEHETVVLIMLAGVTLLISMSKGGLGGMAGTLSAPLMSLVLPPDQVLGLVLPIMLLADIFAVALHWRRWNKRLVAILLPGAIIGVTIGTYFVINVSPQVLKIGLAVISLLFVAYKLVEKRIFASLQYMEKGWHGWLAGTTAGFTSAIAHSGVPPISIFLMLQNVTPRVFIATSVLFYAILNWIKVPYYYFTGLFNLERILSNLWLLPIVPFGVWFGRWLVTKVSKQVFDYIILGLLVITAFILIFG